jgi:outer membrane cobalamin receptor
MSMLRLGRQAAVCRATRAPRSLIAFLIPLIVAVAVPVARAAAAGAEAGESTTGMVVDQAGQALPRALVRVVDASGAESANTFSDEKGRFRLTRVASPGCRIEASLTGFASASVPCDTAPLRIVLHVAPVQETIVVTATRTDAPADQVGVSVTTFTAEDLARRRTPLVADLLRSSPGVMLVRTGAAGGVTSLFVRGGESNYNKVLLDGIPLNEPGGTFYFSNLTTDNLDRVEIVRGAQSALFGSDAMASVVQLFTKRPDPNGRPHAAFTLEAGSYGTVNSSASASGTTGRLDYALGASRISTDNRVPNSDFENTSLSANVGVMLRDSATLRVIGRGELGRNGTPGQTAFGRPDLDAFGERHDGTGGVVFDQQVTPAFRQHASYSLAVSHQQSTNLILDPPYTPRFEDRVASFPVSDFLYDDRTNLRRHHASYQADVRLADDASHGNQLLTVVADWDGERASLEDRLAQTTTPASRNNGGVALQHQALWRRVAVTAGGRLEHNASFGNAAVPRGSLVVVAHEAGGAIGDTRLHAAAGLGIKEPTLLQSFSPSPFFLGNPHLQPERSRSAEAGIEQRLASDRARIELRWFDNRYRNLISTLTTNPATFEAEYFNIGLTRARGAELSADLAPLPAVRLRAGYTFLDSAVIDSTSPASAVLKAGQALFRRPRHSGFVEASWRRNRLSADLTGVFIGQYVDSDFSSLVPPLLDNPGYTTWDARLSFRLTNSSRRSSRSTTWPTPTTWSRSVIRRSAARRAPAYASASEDR